MTKAEKDAAKLAAKAEKDAGETVSDSGEIEIGSPMDLRPKKLPLVVKLPAGASSAQVEYAKILNGYAYQNPKKWEIKKDELTAKLYALAGHELVIDENRKLSINKSFADFRFIKGPGGTFIYAPTAVPVLED